jgi:hypothetical protein
MQLGGKAVAGTASIGRTLQAQAEARRAEARQKQAKAAEAEARANRLRQTLAMQQVAGKMKQADAMQLKVELDAVEKERFQSLNHAAAATKEADLLETQAAVATSTPEEKPWRNGMKRRFVAPTGPLDPQFPSAVQVKGPDAGADGSGSSYFVMVPPGKQPGDEYDAEASQLKSVPTDVEVPVGKRPGDLVPFLSPGGRRVYNILPEGFLPGSKFPGLCPMFDQSGDSVKVGQSTFSPLVGGGGTSTSLYGAGVSQAGAVKGAKPESLTGARANAPTIGARANAPTIAPKPKFGDLVRAANARDVANVTALLARGADPNEVDAEGNTAAFKACYYGDIDMLKLLLKAGCKMKIQNNNGDTPLHVAYKADNRDLITWMEGMRLTWLDEGKLWFDECLTIRNNKGKTCANIREAKELIKAKSKKRKADEKKKKKAGKKPKPGALSKAAKKNKVDKLKEHLENGADPNERDKNGSSPLHHAAWPGHVETSRILIEAGADLTLQNTRKNTCLHLAAESGQLQLMQYFATLPNFEEAVSLRNTNGQSALDVSTLSEFRPK